MKSAQDLIDELETKQPKITNKFVIKSLLQRGIPYDHIIKLKPSEIKRLMKGA